MGETRTDHQPALNNAAAYVLESRVQTLLHPLLIETDREWIVQQLTGEPSFYGYERIKSGVDCRDFMPFLYGLDEAEEDDLSPLEMTIQDMGMDNGKTADIYLSTTDNGLFILLTDATLRHRQQQQIQQIANDVRILNYRKTQLGKKLRAAHAELVVKRRQAETANILKSRFIAGMSHEFRTPLTSILGYTDRLLEQSGPGTELEAIQRGANHLLTLIDGLLDQGRLDAGEFVIRPVPCKPASLARDMLSIFRPLTDEKGLQLNMATHHLPEVVQIDETRLRQILVNLLGNAVKFTDRGQIDISLGYLDQALQIEVSDSGHGIAEDELDKIFLTFQRAGEHNRAGAGLGLSITKQLVERMGGHINVESTLGKGSRFTFVLPAPEIQPYTATAEKNSLTSSPESDPTSSIPEQVPPPAANNSSPSHIANDSSQPEPIESSADESESKKHHAAIATDNLQGDTDTPSESLLSSHLKRLSELSIKPHAADGDTESVQQDSIQTSVQLLLAEDDDDIAELVALYLNDEGVEVVRVDNGQAAIDLALSENPLIILMDMNMPQVNGLDAVRQIRRNNFTGKIFALTAGTSESHRNQALGAGCDEYLAKPIDIPRLIELVQSELGNRPE